MEFADGSGVVEEVLLAHDQRLAVVGRREQPTLVGVPEVVEQLVGGIHRLVDPRGLAGRLAEAGERIEQRSVVAASAA